MRTFLIGVFVLALPLAYGAGTLVEAQAGGGAQVAAPAGDSQAGKTFWEGNGTSCKNCHGVQGQGGFGPDLAGRKLTFAQFRKAVRDPWGVMPMFVDTQVSDKAIADFVAYFDSLPTVAEPGKWRTELPANPAKGQEIAIATIGCGQCHGAVMDTPRHGAAEVNGDWEWFKRMVYTHTTAQPQQWDQLDPEVPTSTPGRGNVRMGNYSRTRLQESLLREVWDYMSEEGFPPVLTGRMQPGVADAKGTMYALSIANGGVRSKGLTAEKVTVAVTLPAGASVVATSGAGYKGVKADEKTKANMAVWELPKVAAGEKVALSITLAQPGDLRGTVKFGKPTVKEGDTVNIVAVRPPQRQTQ